MLILEMAVVLALFVLHGVFAMAELAIAVLAPRASGAAACQRGDRERTAALALADRSSAHVLAAVQVGPYDELRRSRESSAGATTLAEP